MEEFKRQFANDSYRFSSTYFKLAQSAASETHIAFTWLILIVGSVAWFLLLHWIHDARFKAHLPPGPSSWPLVGSLFVLAAKTPIQETLAKLAQRYGPIVFLRLGSLPCVVIGSAEVAEVVLGDPRFAHRATETILHSVRHLEFENEGFMSHYDAQLKLLRKLCTTEILTTSRIAAFAKVRNEDVHTTLKAVAARCQKKELVCLPDVLGSQGLNMMTQMLFGQRLYGSKEEVVLTDLHSFKKNLPQLLQLAGSINVSDLFPAIRWLDLQGRVKVYKRIRAQMEEAYQTIIQENKRRVLKDVGSNNSASFVQVLLSQQKKNQLSDKTIMATIQDVIIGGSETFGKTAEWALAELVRNPQKLRKVQDEIDSVVGRSRPVEETDFVNLPYLRACLRETMRLYPALPLLIPRETKEAVTLNGYSILPKTTVLVNAWQIGRDPAVYKNPDIFEPERWLVSDQFNETVDNHFLAFGAGRRGCVGVKLGTIMSLITLASLLHAFEWGPPPGMDCKDLDLSPTLGMVLVPRFRINFLAAPRLGPAVYNL